ncbi:protein DYAD-like [Impatiens glandulifera]|uniref:protein DYAD-like n=1 Tax=Impatiens glandulifera TaxID=253017 RepID=UPI001FB07EAA|nr:protein DYAD-like [Impatiens glandulifera]
MYNGFVRAADIENMYSNRQRQSDAEDDEQAPSLVKQVLPPSNCTRQGDESTDCEEHIEMGSAYEIDHENLPKSNTTPDQLRSIRVMMVTEKTKTDVTVRYPSIESLQRYFNAKITVMYPEMDERFVMGTKLAEKVLCRKIPSHEFTLMKSSADFWLVNGSSDCGATTEGTCLQELKGSGMVRWGVRRQVRFIGLRKENINHQPSSSFVKGEKTVKQENSDGEEEDDEEEEEDEDEDDEAVTDETDESRSSRKRKTYSRRTPVRLAKKTKLENLKEMKPKNTCKQMVPKNPQDRWSTERYKMAEKNLLEVMKAKGAVYGNPILRPDLRAEARKRIGDTGLLDHLLKQMAGKVAPGGKERFRRRHNAEGAMEYWLENADLVEIRREAGVQDAYWTPPPGWSPGDCPTQDPVCAKELKQLKEVTTQLQRQIEELVSRKQLEEEVSKFRREMKQLLSEKTTTTTTTATCSLEMDHNSSLVTHQSDLHASFDTWEKYKEQLMLVSKSVTRIEEEMGKVKNKRRWEEFPERVTGAENEKRLTEEERQKAGAGERKTAAAAAAARTVVVAGKEGEETAAGVLVAGKKKKASEEKAEKIERLKSGFKICKPQGTFLWPNMGINLQKQLALSPASQLGNLFLNGGGPPSVSSSSASPLFPHQQLVLHGSQSPVRRPLPERRAFSMNLCPLISESSSPRQENCGSNYIATTPTHKTTSILNLNDLPTSAAGDHRIQPGHKIATIISSPIMQQQQQEEQMVIASSSSFLKKSTEMAAEAAAESVGGGKSGRGGIRKTIRPVGGSWLALATPNSV